MRGVEKYGSICLRVKGHVARRRQELTHGKTYMCPCAQHERMWGVGLKFTHYQRRH